MVPRSAQDVADAVAAQERNRAWLKEHAGL